MVLMAGVLSCGDGTEPVLLATEGAYHPFNFINDDGEIDGLERELGDELCRRAELQCEWLLNDWESMIPDLVAGEFDAIIAGMSITDERDETIDFTEPYYPPTPSVYLALADAGDEAVQGRLGAYANTIYSDYFTERGIPYTEFSSEEERIEALLNGDIDASLVDHAYAVDKLAEHEGRLTVVGPSVLLDRGIGIGVREDNDLLEKLNSALASMKTDGSLNTLIVKWIGEDPPTFSEASTSSPVPVPTVTPAPLPASTATLGVGRDREAVPSIPQGYLEYSGRLYPGWRGSYCWPVSADSTVCSESAGWRDFDTAPTVRVIRGDGVKIVVSDEDPSPEQVQLAMYPVTATKPVLRWGEEVYSTDVAEAEAHAPDIPEGIYFVHVFIKFHVGDVSYGFKVEIVH